MSRRAWRSRLAALGVAGTISVAATVTTATVTAAPAIAGQPSRAPGAVAARIGSSTFPVTGTDTSRPANALVVYTDASRGRTPTNVYGAEVVVVRGVVTAVHDRQRTLGGATRIPAGGLVLSGHGTARAWLLRHARRAATVGLLGAKPRPAASPPGQPSARAVPTSSAPMPYPTKAVALYHMMWYNAATPKLSATPAQVNVVNLAFAQGTVPTLGGWGSQTEASFIADAKALRARGVRIVVSVGGESGQMHIADRQSFVRGIMAINDKLPLDGLDWDLEGAEMATADVLAISAQLKALRGSAFAITMAPNGSNIDQYRAIAVQLHAAGNLDMIGQQFYDAVVSNAAARGRIDQLVAAGIPQSKIGIGMMVGDRDVYWTVEECISAVSYIKSAYPNLRGGYLWEAGRAGTSDWARRVGSMLGT
jgi:hypothetical protein